MNEVITTPKIIRLEHLKHHGAAQIKIIFEYDKVLAGLLKKIPGARWSATHRCWYLQNSRENLKLLYQTLKGAATIDGSLFFAKKQPAQPAGNNQRPSAPDTRPPTPALITKRLTDEQQRAVAWFRKWMLSAGYAENTIDTYNSLLEIFFTYIKDKPVREVTENDVINFNADFIVKTGRSDSYQRQCINAIKVFYAQVKDRKLRLDKLERVKKAKTLPNVLSLEEVKALLGSYENPKHKALIVLTYACGLRRSEVLNLKWKDIDRERMLLKVRLGKGKKDRQVILPEMLLHLLEVYYRKSERKPKEYVFEGQNGGQYTATSFSQVLKQGLKRAGIKKNVSLHSLRHSYATHLHEQGTDIAIIQQLLGHSSIKTTLIYTHVSKKTLHGVKNPIDNMNI